MSRFQPVLRALDDSLVLPQPARSRVLLEIAGDLEAFFDCARSEGVTDEEAERLALEAFHPSSETVTALVRLHGSPVALLLDGLSSQARTLWERLLLALVLLPAAALTLPAVADLQLVRAAGRAGWLLVGVGAAMAAVVVLKAYQLLVKLDHRPRLLRRGMTLLLGLSLAPAPLGVLAFSIGLFRALGEIVTRWPADGGELLPSLLTASAVMSLALTATAAGLLAWFILSRRIVRIEVQGSEALLGPAGKGETDV